MGISNAARRSLIERELEKPLGQRGKCPMCGRKATGWQIDHKHPRCRGGTSLADNLWIVCEECNGLKGNRTLYELAKAGVAVRLRDNDKEEGNGSEEEE